MGSSPPSMRVARLWASTCHLTGLGENGGQASWQLKMSNGDGDTFPMEESWYSDVFRIKTSYTIVI